MSLNTERSKKYMTHGSGSPTEAKFGACGDNVILEPGVLVFWPENIRIGSNVYVGHRSILKAYHINLLEIGDHTWIGQDCFMHSAGGLRIGKAVGIGPSVKIITSSHRDNDINLPVLYHELEFKPVVIEDGADIGVASVILPGVTIGEGAIVGAGSIVTRDVERNSIVAGNPARLLRVRGA